MYKMRRKRPFRGRYVEFTYKENVSVVDGHCTVRDPLTRDALLLRGYEVIPVEKPKPEVPKVSKKSGKYKTKKKEPVIED